MNNQQDKFTFLKPNYPHDQRYENIKITEKKYKIPINRPVRIYCDGIFDLFHYGHSRLLEQVKNLFPNVFVIVGVCNDKLTTKFKGSVVMNEQERYESVRQCKFTDEVIENAPWILDMEFLEKHKIDFVAHDEAPYPYPGMEDLYEFVKKRGMFIPTKRASKISTTELITRLIRNYDQFLRRQILRGIHYKDLNISFIKKEQIKLKEMISSEMKLVKKDIKVALCFWESLSKQIIFKFKNKFFKKKSSSYLGLIRTEDE